MLIASIQFPARRYHATPTEAHVNEGRVEWPPSPWRILRALLAVGYTKLGWGNGPDEDSRAAIVELAGCLPHYSLPCATEAHTRHYMDVREGRQTKSVKIFDSFIRFASSDARLLVRYDVDLSRAQREAVDRLFQGLGYLGRAESWADARLLSAAESEGVCERANWCRPASDSSPHRLRLLSAMPETEFDKWREQEVVDAAARAEAAASVAAEAKGKTLTPAARQKARLRAENPYPTSLLAALEQETKEWQGAGWPFPPGGRWVDYGLPHDYLDNMPVSLLAAVPRTSAIDAALLAIDGEGARGTVRPLRRYTLGLMESLHLAAVSRAVARFDQAPMALTGKEACGAPLRGHLHAHWIPLNLVGGSANQIDHVLVHAPGGLCSKSLAALADIRATYSKGLSRLAVNLVGCGRLSDIDSQLSSLASVRQGATGPISESTVWRSLTPLVLRKHLHRHGRRTVEGQLREELHERGFPDPVAIDIWSQRALVEHRLKGYVLRRRSGKQQPPREASWGATITFSSPQRGTLALGYASHFGLGVFAAD